MANKVDYISEDGRKDVRKRIVNLKVELDEKNALDDEYMEKGHEHLDPAKLKEAQGLQHEIDEIEKEIKRHNKGLEVNGLTADEKKRAMVEARGKITAKFLEGKVHDAKEIVETSNGEAGVFPVKDSKGMDALFFGDPEAAKAFGARINDEYKVLETDQAGNRVDQDANVWTEVRDWGNLGEFIYDIETNDAVDINFTHGDNIGIAGNTANDRINNMIIGEGGTGVRSSVDVDLRHITVGAWVKNAGPVPVSLKQEMNSAFSTQDWVRSELVDALGSVMNEAMTVGTGATTGNSPQPHGIVNAAKEGLAVARNRAATAGGIYSFDDILALIAAVPSKYRRRNPRTFAILMNSASAFKTRGLKQGSGATERLIQSDLQTGLVDRLAGFRVGYNEAMDDIGTSSTSTAASPVVAGNFRYYGRRLVRGALMARWTTPPYGTNHQVAYQVIMLGDARPLGGFTTAGTTGAGSVEAFQKLNLTI